MLCTDTKCRVKRLFDQFCSDTPDIQFEIILVTKEVSSEYRKGEQTSNIKVGFPKRLALKQIAK